MEEIKTETIIKKILTTEVKYVIGIILFVFGVISPFYEIKTEIALIKQNHLTHIENMQKEILEIKQNEKDVRETEIKLMEKISELINNSN